MTITVNCDGCSAQVDTINCAECHAKAQRCDTCSRHAHRLICETCAEAEYTDDSPRKPEEDDLRDFIENSVMTDDVGDLAAAIRAGRREDAEYLLDKIARGIPGWEERISVARYSPLARAA